VTYQKPIPTITRDMQPFFDAAKRHELVVQRCMQCGTHRFPAREICSSCLSRDVQWVRVAGTGHIFSYNVMHQVYHPGFAAEVPYAVAIVQLSEGPRMLSNLVDCPIDRIAVDMPVEVVFERVSETVTLPKFRPVGHPPA